MAALKFTVSVLAVWLLTAGYAQAAHPHNCSRTATVEALLANKFDEAVKFEGTSGEYIARVFVSADGSWSLVYTHPRGFSCIMEGGSNWQEVEWKPGRKS